MRCVFCSSFSGRNWCVCMNRLLCLDGWWVDMTYRLQELWLSEIWTAKYVFEFQNMIYNTFVVMLEVNFLFDSCIVKVLAVRCYNWGLRMVGLSCWTHISLTETIHLSYLSKAGIFACKGKESGWSAALISLLTHSWQVAGCIQAPAGPGQEMVSCISSDVLYFCHM